MARAFYIVGIVFGFIFTCVTGFFLIQVRTLRSLERITSFDPSSSPFESDWSSMYTGIVERATTTAATICVFFFVIFLTVSLIGLLKVKTNVNKVFAIIGLGLAAIFFGWNFIVLFRPAAISFDEVGGAYIFYGLSVVAFSIVGLVQAIKYVKIGSLISYNKDLLDS